MKSRMFRWLAIFLILQAGVFHYAIAQTQYYKAPYLGYLAVATFIASLMAAFLIYYKQVFGWALGLLVSTGSIIGFVLTRLIALPGLTVEPWRYPYGMVGTFVEGIFILFFLIVRPWRRNEVGQPETLPARFFLIPLTGLILLTTITYATYQWDIYASEVGYHLHVGSVDAVCSSPFTSFAELEDRYGIQVSLVVVTAMDSFIDVRLKVVDPLKAQALLKNQAALLVNRQTLILAPHLHMHWKLKPEKLFLMFFPTQNNTIQRGSEVSLVFGNVRVEPVIVR